MPVRKRIDPRLVITAALPGPVQHIFIHHRIHIQRLERAAQTHASVRGFRIHAVQLSADIGEIARNHRLTSEIAQVRPDEILPMEMFGLAINLDLLAIVVQHDQPPLGHRCNIGLDPFRRPHLALVPEKPAHLEPDCFGIVFADGLIGETCRICQIVRLPRRRIHFVEEVHPIDMAVLPVCLLLLP